MLEAGILACNLLLAGWIEPEPKRAKFRLPPGRNHAIAAARRTRTRPALLYAVDLGSYSRVAPGRGAERPLSASEAVRRTAA